MKFREFLVGSCPLQRLDTFWADLASTPVASNVRAETRVRTTSQETIHNDCVAAVNEKATFSFSEVLGYISCFISLLIVSLAGPKVSRYDGSGILEFPKVVHSSLRVPEPAPMPQSTLTVFNMLQSGPSYAEVDVGSLPGLPSDQVGNDLVEAVYAYTQARYCILDWVQLRQWHEQRQDICFSSTEDDLEAQTGTVCYKRILTNAQLIL